MKRDLREIVNEPSFKLKDYNVGIINVGPKEIKYVSELVKINTSITEIEIVERFNNPITNLCFLCESLQFNTSVTYLQINNRLELEDIEHISKLIKINKSITRLDLGHNPMIGTQKGMMYLSTALKINTSITQLHLNHNAYTVEATKSLMKVIEFSSNIKILFLKNSLGIECIKYLSTSLRNCHITQLDLRDNHFGETGAKYISSCLAINKSITHLRIGSNNIGDKGTKYLSNSLKNNTTITYLDYGENQIGEEGRKLIAEVLSINTTIRQIMF